MRRIKIVPLLIASAVLAAVIGLAACGGGDDNGGGGDGKIDLTIGDSIPLTGDFPTTARRGRRHPTWRSP